MQPLHLAVQQFVLSTPGVARVIVAYSGGVDSTVLLHCLAKALLPYPLVALHVNHQLSANAGDWQQHCARVCAQLELECIQERVQVKAEMGGTEQAAREARYRAFDRHLREGDLLLLAHHQQDQGETFLLRLFRGSGVKGLGSMAPLRQHGSAQLGRPLLECSKQDLLDYARSHALRWIEDDSNQLEHFERNFLRAQVVPKLELRWPRALRQIACAADRLREAQALLADYAGEDLGQCSPKIERVGHSIELLPLRDWSAPRRQNVVRAWLDCHGYRMPSHKQLQELDLLLNAQVDRVPLLNWQDCELRRFKNRLFCLPAQWQAGCEMSDEGMPLTLNAGARGVIATASAVEVIEAEAGLCAGANLTLKLRKHCSHVTRAQPASRAHSQSLKKLLQEHGLEPWLRPYLPMVFAGERLVAVGDLWVEKSHLHYGASAVRLLWRIGRARGRL